MHSMQRVLTSWSASGANCKSPVRPFEAADVTTGFNYAFTGPQSWDTQPVPDPPPVPSSPVQTQEPSNLDREECSDVQEEGRQPRPATLKESETPKGKTLRLALMVSQRLNG